ncbi:MAG: rod shape-determining protein, partial [Patescibacteria group bacterium]|nr:rod shape-determining protein [Patescibacteria group bacterium]
FFSSLNRRLGIDLGSCRTRIWLDGEGLVLDEASVLAIDQKQGKIIAVGDKALEMEGRVDESITVSHPIQQPKVTNKEYLSALLKVFLHQASEKNYFFSPSIVVSLASNTSPVVREAVAEVISDLGAKEVLVVSQPLAAAIGCGVPIADASGCFILQLGGFVVEAAVISLGKMINSEAVHWAGLTMDQHLRHYLRQEKKLKISQRQAERLKINLGTLNPNLERRIIVSGKDLQQGSVKEVKISTQDIMPVIEFFAGKYQLLVKQLLSKVPPDLTTDLIDKGLLLTGSLAEIDELDNYLANALSLPVAVVDKPDLSVVEGLGAILKHLDQFKQSLGYY